MNVSDRSRFPCPKCRSLSTRITRTATSPENGTIVRRRTCSSCDHRWYTGQEPEFLLGPQRITWLGGFPVIQH